MHAHTNLIRTAALLSLQGVGIVWLLSAVWFAARLRASAWGRVWHFLRTLLPEPWLVVGLPVLLLLLSFVPAEVWRSVTDRQPVVQAVGAALVVASSLLMVWARLVLGDMWAGRPMVQEDHELRTGGPYQMVRHPIYTGFIGAVLGMTMLSGFGELLVVLVAVAGWLLWRVRVEDRMMVAVFGDRYRSYQRRVPALLPVPRGLAQ